MTNLTLLATVPYCYNFDFKDDHVRFLNALEVGILGYYMISKYTLCITVGVVLLSPYLDCLILLTYLMVRLKTTDYSTYW